jgi:predicted nucleic acid-binding protein
MIVVCDASPVIALARCDALSLVDALFDSVLVPQTVYRELTVRDKPEADKIAAWAHGKVVVAANQRLRSALNLLLDAGESEAMTVYWEKGADFLLMDEKKGRKVAALNEMHVVGTLGILVTAKQKGLIPAITPAVDRLRHSDIRISEELYRKTLALAGE